MAGLRAEQTTSIGLTTTRAPYIEQAQAEGRLYITQPYELYSEANHDAWRRLFTRMEDRWRRYANPRFLQGIDSLCLDPERVPRLEDVNRFLSPLTGFQAKPVSGYVPSFLFFDCLHNREFPTTITIRDGATLDSLPARRATYVDSLEPIKVYRAHTGRGSLVDLKNDVDPILRQLNDLGLDGGGEAALTTVQLEDAADIVLDAGARIDHPGARLYFSV